MNEFSVRRTGLAVHFSFACIAALALTVPVMFGDDFKNPAQVASHDGKLKAVIQMSDADRTVPEGGKQHLRYFQGWDYDKPTETKAPANVAIFAPGPTLRARVGDKVQIMFLNTVNDDNFPYTFVTAEGKANPAFGCDEASNPAVYPAKDRYPNCFHGSSTANLHFHGTHVSPDAVGDNVLVQVMPRKSATQDAWKATFDKIFAMQPPPFKWDQLPADYRDRQKALFTTKEDLELWKSNEEQIALEQWPQYFAGAYPNSFTLPDESSKLKAEQAPGTHWYHAHKHGSTALHTLNGLAGAFIIEGKYDDFIRKFYGLTKYEEKFEKVFVIQQIDPDLDLERTVPKDPAPPALVNGMYQPTLTMTLGEVQLWRFINATSGSITVGVGAMPFGTIKRDKEGNPVLDNGKAVVAPVPFEFKQTAADGVQLSPANYLAQTNMGRANSPGAGVVLAGGNRVDVLVRAPMTPSTPENPYQFKLKVKTGEATLFSVSVTPNPSANWANRMKFPCEVDPGPNCWLPMPAYLKDLAQPKDYPHHVTFGWDAEPGRTTTARMTSSVGINLPPKFTIDNHQFDEFGPAIDQCMPLGGIQDWVLENNTTVAHPFHIHINPFQVLKIEAPSVDTATNRIKYTTTAPTKDFVWQDVVAIPGGVLLDGQFAAGRVTIRQHFADFTGTFVLHCHILAHEDRGMMQMVRIVPADKFPEKCQIAIPSHH